MNKAIIIAAGIVVVIVIVAMLGLAGTTGKETKIALNSTNNNTVSTLSKTPVIQGRNLSVNLTEHVGVGAH